MLGDLVALENLFADILNYLQANLAGAIAAGVILLYLLFKKPKIFFMILVAGIIAVGMLHVYTKLTGLGLGDIKAPSFNEDFLDN